MTSQINSIQNRYELMRKNNGEPAKQINSDQFEFLLCVLPPANWTHSDNIESFMVDECQTANLYTWVVRVNSEYWEMIAPKNSTVKDLLEKIEAATQTA